MAPSLWLATPQQQGAARFVVNEIFTKKRYDHPGFQIQPADTVVDIGANMGIFVLWAARQCYARKSGGHRADQRNRRAAMNVERNGLTNVCPVQAACGPTAARSKSSPIRASTL